MCSVAGLFVGNLGLNSLRTMELRDIDKYVYSLLTLAVCSVALRLAWLVDVILQVQHLVDESQADADGGNGDGDGGGGGGDGDDGGGEGDSGDSGDGEDGGGDGTYGYLDISNGDIGDSGEELDEGVVLTFGIQVSGLFMPRRPRCIIKLSLLSYFCLANFQLFVYNMPLFRLSEYWLTLVIFCGLSV